MATSSGLFFSDNLQPIATRGKKALGMLLVDQNCGNGCSIKRAPLSVSYYHEINGGHIGRGGGGVVRRRCSAGLVLPLWCYSAELVKHHRSASLICEAVKSAAETQLY